MLSTKLNSELPKNSGNESKTKEYLNEVKWVLNLMTPAKKAQFLKELNK